MFFLFAVGILQSLWCGSTQAGSAQQLGHGNEGIGKNLLESSPDPEFIEIMSYPFN